MTSAIGAAMSISVSLQAAGLQPPSPPEEPHELSAHGDVRTDPYYWMRHRNDPRVRKHLEAENAYTESVLRPLAGLREELYREMVARIPQEDESVPYLSEGYLYYHRYAAGQEHPIYCRREVRPGAPEEVILDVNSLAQPGDYVLVEGMDVSLDGRWLAYAVDTAGNHRNTIRVRDLQTGETLPLRISETSGEVVWSSCGRWLLYGRLDETGRTEAVMAHRTGTDPATDRVVYAEEDPTFWPWVWRSKDDRHVLIASSSTLTSWAMLLPAGDPLAEPTVVQAPEAGHEYWVSAAGDSLYILTNRDAPNYRLVRAPVNSPGMESWQELLPHREDVFLEDLDVFSRWLVLTERTGGLTRLRVISRGSGEQHVVDTGGEPCLVYTSSNHEMDTDTLRFLYTSMTTPWTTYDYDMTGRTPVLLKREKVGGGFSPEDYESLRLVAVSEDGTEVPVSLVYRPDSLARGSNPLLVYGYGAYGESLDPTFSSSRLSLLDRGFVYAMAHVRGGQEMGRSWYEDGRVLNKKNSFTDFIACTEHLLAEGWGDPARVFAMGGSAGGLLVGAVTNSRPDLYAGVVAGVPFVDVVTTMGDPTIPLTTSEYDEWGDPSDPGEYRYMLSYSPYDNVREAGYPAMLVTAGFNDSQVGYWEPAKWVARLRDRMSGGGPVLLYTEMGYGHGGASGRFEWLRLRAMEYAFLLGVARGAL
jgi:oligopeptidase B